MSSENDFDGLDLKTITSIIGKHTDNPGALMGVLESVQIAHPHKYLPKGVLREISTRMKIPLSQIYNVVTFYSMFNLKPQGKHCITVCRGTTCHAKGSRGLLEQIIEYLHLTVEEEPDSGKFMLTTDDRNISVRTVACFGQCALSPVVEVDGMLYCNVTWETVKELIDKINKGDKK